MANPTSEVEQVAAEVRTALEERGIAVDGVEVVDDPFDGICVRVVSAQLADVPGLQHWDLALARSDSRRVGWLDVLRPEEVDEATPLEHPIDPVPAWPEALARGRDVTHPLTFASELGKALPAPAVVTFYSLRGGVGQSTALAYTAQLLARAGRRVLCIDAHFQAPGLLPLFGHDDRAPDYAGLASLLIGLDMGNPQDVAEDLTRLSGADKLYLLPAGRPTADHARSLRLLRPEAWYREEVNPLHQLLDAVADLEIRPEVVLLDAGSGITWTNAPLLFDVPDLVVLAFPPHQQARTGTERVVRALLAATSRRTAQGMSLTPEPRFLVPMVPGANRPEGAACRARATDWVAEWLRPLNDQRPTERRVRAEDVTHFVPYSEATATTGQVVDDPRMAEPYKELAAWVEQLLPAGRRKAGRGRRAGRNPDRGRPGQPRGAQRPMAVLPP